MKKFYSNFKKVVAAVVLASMTLAASCSYDDTDIKNRLEEVEKDLTALTERVAALEKRLGEEVEALTALINGKVVVTGVEKVGDATKVTLSDGSSFTVYPECTVVDTDTDTNVYITVQKDTDGVLYFAVYENDTFKEWLLVDGQKVPVYDGNDDTQDDNICDNPYVPVVPQFRTNLETGNIEVSIDGGATWFESGLTAAATGGQLFTGVAVGDNTVTFTLVDGSSFEVMLAELIEFDGRGHVYVKAGESKEVAFTVNDAVVDINVINQPLGWKAEVALAPADEDEVDDEMGVLAAGGLEFVLKVTGPAKDLVKGGIAEKSGAIQVHFNTANGACKIGKLLVDLAELTLDVDKQGNITITNSLVTTYEYQDWWTGETTLLTDFNNFYAGVMPLDSYSGNLKYDLSEAWKDCAAGFNTNYGYYEGFYGADGVTMYQAAYFEDGVTEIDTLKTTVKAYVDNFSYGYFGYEGESFVVFAMPVDMTTGDQIWEEALIVEFKQANVKVEEREDLRSFNNVYFDATLRGCTAYQFNIQPLADLEKMIEQQWYDSIDHFFETSLYYWSAYGSQFGNRITTDVKENGISLMDLYNYQTPYIQHVDLAPATKYVMAILPEQADKTAADYTVADLVMVYFETADIVAATTPAEYAAEYNNEKTNFFQIGVDVTVPENTAVTYSAWYNEEQLDEEALKNDLIKNGWAKTDYEDGYTYTLTRSVDAPSTVMYLGLLIVDEEGNYTIAMKEFSSLDVVYSDVEVGISSVEFTESSATVEVSGIEGMEIKAIKYYMIATDASSYYQKTEEQLAELSYKEHWLYQAATENPFTITRMPDYNSTWVGGKTYKVAVAVQFADGTVSRVAYGEYYYYAGAADVVAEKFEFKGNYKDLDDDESTAGGNGVYTVRGTGFKAELIVNFNFRDAETGALTEGTYSYTGIGDDYVYGSDPTFAIVSGSLNGVAFPQYMWGSTMTVTAEGITLNLLDAEGRALANVTYEGAPTIVDNTASGNWIPAYAEISKWKTNDEYHFIYIDDNEWMVINWYNGSIWGSGASYYYTNGSKGADVDTGVAYVFEYEYLDDETMIYHNVDITFQDGHNIKFSNVTIGYTH